METSGRGCACAVHAAFGNPVNGSLVASEPRAFIRACFGDDAAEFLAKLDDEDLATRVKDFLWKAVMKPHACGIAPVIPCSEIPGPEEQQIARQIIADNPIVVTRCREAVVHAQSRIHQFTLKRRELGEAFAATCIEDLRRSFVVPLFSCMNILREYENTPHEVHGTKKLDAREK